MEKNDEVTVDQATMPSETEKHISAEVSETNVTTTKNIMFPSLSDEMLTKIVKRRHGDAGTQSR